MSDVRNVVNCAKCHNAKCTLSQMEIRTAVCTGYKPWTNYDKIHNMNVEQLASYICKVQYHDGDVCPPNHNCSVDKPCEKCWLEWLNSEVENDITPTP